MVFKQFIFIESHLESICNLAVISRPINLISWSINSSETIQNKRLIYIDFGIFFLK